MNIEELMSVKIAAPASLTHMNEAEIPASITTIDAEMIKQTPARKPSPGTVGGLIHIITKQASGKRNSCRCIVHS